MYVYKINKKTKKQTKAHSKIKIVEFLPGILIIKQFPNVF